jgi:hypothetical protein
MFTHPSRLILSITASAIYCTVLAQSNFQALWDTTSVQPHLLVNNAVVTAGGEQVVSLHVSNGLRLVKADAFGMPVWNKGYGGASPASQVIARPYVQLLSTPDGHIVQVHGDSTSIRAVSHTDIDTSEYFLGVMSVTADGAVDYYRRIKCSLLGYDPFIASIYALRAGMDSEQNIFIGLEAFDGNMHRCVIMKLDPLGQVLWTDHVANEAFNSTPGSGTLLVTPDGSGGCYASKCRGQGWSTAAVVHFDMNGGIAWFKHFTLNNTVISMDATGSLVASNGDLLLSGYLISVAGHGFLLRIAPNGDLLQGELYDPNLTLNVFDTLDDLVIGRLTDPYANSGPEIYLALDPEGIPVNTIRAIPMTSEGVARNLVPTATAMVGDRLHAIGDQRSVDETLNYTTNRPAIWSFGFEAETACGLLNTVVPHSNIEPAFMATSDAPYTLEAFLLDTQTVAMEVTDYPVWGAEQGCGTTIGVPDPGSQVAFSVISSFGSIGHPIMVRTGAPALLVVHDVTGSIVKGPVTSGKDGLTAIDVDALASGFYLVTVRSRDGNRFGMARVVVE